MEKHNPSLAPSYKIYFFFILGLTTAIAFRSLIVFDHIRPSWVRSVWYFAVLGNLVFFFHRFSISGKRKNAIREFELIEKIQTGECLSGTDRDALVYILQSIKLSPENINYLVIFLFSILAIGVDITLSYFY